MPELSGRELGNAQGSAAGRSIHPSCKLLPGSDELARHREGLRGSVSSTVTELSQSRLRRRALTEEQSINIGREHQTVLVALKSGQERLTSLRFKRKENKNKNSLVIPPSFFPG